MVYYKLPDDGGCVAVAAMIGMSADATDLGIAIEHDAFAAHGDEFSLVSNAKVGAHPVGSVAKEAGKRKRGESDHVRAIGRSEWDEFDARIRGIYFARQYHLEALERLEPIDLRCRRKVVVEEPKMLAIDDEGCELLKSGSGWRADCGEGRDIRRIPAGLTDGHGEVFMLRLQSVPYGICEGAYWRAGH